MKLELTLPGQWFCVPLGAADLSEHLRGFARELLGNHDRNANARALLHRRILHGAQQAAGAKAEQLYLGVALTDEVPLPGTITVYPAIAMATTREVDAKSVMDAAIPLLVRAETEPEGGEPVPSAEDRVFTVADRMVLRRPRIRIDADNPEAPPALLIDYWVTVPGSNRVQLVHVSLPEAVHTELYTTLFDEIVFASRYVSDGDLRADLAD